MRYRTYKTQAGAERYREKLCTKYPERRAMFYVGVEPQRFWFCVYYQLPDGRPHQLCAAM
jgi:hypothetical protein